MLEVEEEAVGDVRHGGSTVSGRASAVPVGRAGAAVEVAGVLDETVLEENMTFPLICGMWMTGYGYEVSETIRVTSTGVETFTSFPRQIIRK